MPNAAHPRRRRPLVRLAATFAGLLAVLGATSAVGSAARGAGPPARHSTHGGPTVPFHVGEKLTYNAKINFLRVGTASMSVQGVEDIRGHQAYHTVFRVQGRMLFFKVDDHYESWFDTASLSSYRYLQNIDEGNYEADRTYEFFPERQTLSENGKPEEPSVPDPLDDASFIYFVRSIPLEVGQTYEFNRYFRPDRNPVKLIVLRKDHIKIAAGEFDAVVVQPQIKAGGIFSDKSHAELWFSDDSTRMMLKMQTGLPFGTLHLELRQIENKP